MAAISALMINDNALRNEGPEDDKAPTTPRIASPRTPKPYDTAAESRSPQPAQPSPHASLTSQDQPHSVQEPEPAQGAQGDQARSDDMEIDPVEDDDDDDQDTEPGESGSTSRKKKGQRFFCTGYPPCNLSFTRSEHLARHIRKHTGERPFQCHCNRRFSRLDNLRQHAQTVHVNEEIPTDSLAATGTRYQRQIRTDRVRPAGRPRTSTMSSTGSHSRGHSRNVSTSSIGSTSSNYDMSNETRRRPPPLLMAGDAINRPSTPPSQFPPFPNSPADMSTPTSSTYPATPSSPGVGSTIGSPVSAISRTSGYYPSSSRTPGRRLSVPSGINQYQGIFGNPYGSQIGGPSPGPGSNFSSNSSAITSPTSSTFSFMPGYHVPPGEDWRRRTWHPSTYSGLNFNYGRPATSGLTYSQTPDAPRPAYAPNATAAAGQAPRLPGIESFDHVQHRPTTPPRRNPSPMQIDTGRQVPPLMPASDVGGTRDRQRSWEGSRTGQYPDVDDSSARGVTSWGQQTIEQIHNVARPRPPYEQNSMGPPPFTNTSSAHQQIAQEALHLQSPSKQTKRTGWYNGQPVGTRTSPEDSSSSDGVPTPGTSTIDVHPAIVQSNGYIESQHAMIPADAHQNPCYPQPMQGPTSFAQQQTRRDISEAGEQGTGPHNMNRLEALVAVATSEKNSSTGAR